MDIKGTQTEKNLLAAFSGESMARNKYTYFAEAAKKEGHEEIAQLFERMARNESIHGKLLYQKLFGGIGDSKANLADAMNGEYKEWTSMYPEFAETARREGLTEAAELFDKIAKIERDHEHSFLQALSGLMSAKSGTSSPAEKEKEAEEVMVQGYRCMFCGASYEKRPDVCGVCGAIGSFESAQFKKQI